MVKSIIYTKMDEEISSKYLWCWSITVSLSNFYFGYFLNETSPFWNLAPCIFSYDLSSNLTRNVIATQLVGLFAAISGVFVGYFLKYGHRRMLMINTGIVVISCGVKIIPFYEAFIIGRILSGIVVGISCTTVPIFLKEISPPQYKGFVMGFSQQMITIGVGCCFSLGLTLPDAAPSNDKIDCSLVKDRHIVWRIFFIFPILVALIQLILFLTCFNLENPGFMTHNRNTEYDSFITKMIDMKKQNKINDSDGTIDDVRSIIKRQKNDTYANLFKGEKQK